MSKFSFKVGFILPMILILVTVLYAMPVSAADEDYFVDGYCIKGYDVHVKVNENNVLDITEKITTDFEYAKHGINRNIPVDSNVTWVIHGKKVSHTYNLKITHIYVKDGVTGKPIDFEKNRDGDNLQLKIGDSNQTFTGLKTYVISYSLGVGSDDQTQFDELYYNLIGNNWDAYIDNVTFAIDMPKSFDKSLLNFTSGVFGSEDNSNIEYTVSGDTITGKVTDILKPGEGVTVRLELPDGYFTGNDSDVGLGLLGLFFVFLLLTLILFFAFGKDAKVYPTVEVSPPDDINPAEAGFIIKGHAQTRDAVSLIIYWANKGYLSIENDATDNFTLVKLKDAGDDMRSYEMFMFNKLFEDREKVTASDLQYKFHDTMEKVYSDIADHFSTPSKSLYTASGNKAKKWCYIFAGLCTGIMIGKGFGNYYFSFFVGIIAGVVGFFATILLAMIIGYYAELCRGRSKTGVVVSIIIYIVFLFVAMTYAANYTGQGLAAVWGAVVAAICGIVGSYSKKRTVQSNQWLGRILGLKRFIELCEKRKIETLVEDDPSLFYGILPYAFALDIVNKWSEKFTRIALPPPSWYNSTQDTIFNTIYFTSLLNQNLNTFQSNMTSTPPSNDTSSGGTGGVGSSGGGVGGGGGSSW